MNKPARRRFWIDIVGDARDHMPCDAYDSPKFEDLIPVSELLPGDVILTREEAERISCVIRGLECEQSGGCDPCSNNKELINELWKFGETIQSEINQQTKEAT